MAQRRLALFAIEHIAHSLAASRRGLRIAFQRISNCDSRPFIFRLTAFGTAIRKSRLAWAQLKLFAAHNALFYWKSHNRLF